MAKLQLRMVVGSDGDAMEKGMNGGDWRRKKKKRKGKKKKKERKKKNEKEKRK